MMEIPLYQVDAFTSRMFGGNYAAVCPLDDWLDEDLMQAIAAENNLPETAFFVPEGDDYGLRWFTPVQEIDLAGHPTLATAHIIMSELDPGRDEVRFHTKIGDELVVTRRDGRLVMDFPSRPPVPHDGIDIDEVAAALGARPRDFLANRDGFAIFESEAEVRALAPDMGRVAAFDFLGIIATAPGDDCDFVSRFFAPGAGVPEDPVTGSAHTELIPYWSQRLGKTEMFARQISPRGGEIWCEDKGERVGIAGQAVTYMQGTIRL